MSADATKSDAVRVELPAVCLVLLVGVSGAGKSTFARAHFKATEVLSSDACRGLVSDDENDQGASGDAFELLHFIASKRLARGLLTVVDATNVRAEDRRSLIEVARRHDCLTVAIVFDVSTDTAVARNQARTDRKLGAWVVNQQRRALRQGLRGMKREGLSRVHTLGEREVERAVVVRRPLYSDLRHERGPFDIIGDVHGCYAELLELLGKLGYRVGGTREAPEVTPPPGRKAIFLGDLIDRGPDAPGALRLAMAMVRSGDALAIVGNHENKYQRKLGGKDVKLRHGLERTVAQMAEEPDAAAFAEEVRRFIGGLRSHYVLDDGRLVVAHAGLREIYHGRASGRVRSFAMYGETSGEIDAFGHPVRAPWAEAYRGAATVVYGHTPTPVAEWVNNTICIDTGCCFGGKLTALRYPERELVEVEAAEVYYASTKPLARPTAAETDGRRAPGIIDVRDVTGKRQVETRVLAQVTLREENAVAALEVMSRFAVDPRWLIYLPPTMSPSETAPADSPLLERPEEAFAHFAGQGVAEVVCQEKHMGSRAVLVVARSPGAAAARFAVADGKQGVIYTRTGRPFFAGATGDARERALVERVAAAAERAGLFDSLASDWLCLDAELMPWSVKARDLLRSQYAAVGAAGAASLRAANELVAAATARGVDTSAIAPGLRAREAMLAGYNAAWRRYCWEAATIDDLRLAPFHLLASEGAVHDDRDHVWHMETLAALATHDPILVATPYRVVDLGDAAAREAAAAWWRELTDGGGEGMVIKPREWVARGKKGFVQPALKCRGPEYLRIIYGPEYTAPENLERLRKRGLGRKRSLALREFSLGLEALHRFVDREGLWRVHECVFGVLALESEPVDPRL
ncbi:MAG: polynucleotide kinase-phosphatase [Nannocystaceae bacterium]